MTAPQPCAALRRDRLRWLDHVIRKHQTTLLVLLVLLDVIVVVVGLLLAAVMFSVRHPDSGGWSGYWTFVLVAALCAVPVFERFGLYRQQRSMMNLIEIRKVLRAVLVLAAGMAVSPVVFAVRYPPAFFVLAGVTVLCGVLAERMLLFKLQQWVRLRGVDVRRVLIIGAGETGRLLYQSICHAPKLGYRVVGILDTDPGRLRLARQCLRGWDEDEPLLYDDPVRLPRLVAAEQIDALFISNLFHEKGDVDIQALATFCREHGVQLHFLPYLQGHATLRAQLQDVNGISVISFGVAAPGRIEQIAKRIFDLILAGLFLLFLLPLFGLLALLIRRDSPGPVFFRQTRVGRDGHLFSMYKFRTMYMETPDYGFSPRCSHDPRITPLGRLLRKTSLDELPQLWNVVRGEMSLVGPRPEMPFIVEQHASELYRQRLLVKPGITGVWQISGDRTREIHDNISYDIFYIENRSLLLDVIILIRTVIFGVLAMRTH